MVKTKKFQCNSIKACIRQFTNIDAKIYFSEDSSSIIVAWKGKLPSKEEINQIKSALKNFGKVTPTYSWNQNVVSFIID